MTATLAQQLTLYTQEQWYAILLAVCQAGGFPVQSWQDGGVEKTRLLAMSAGLVSLGNYLPAIAGGTLLDYAPNYQGWTGLTAQQLYDLAQNLAVFTQGNVLATNVATTPYVFTAGGLKFNFGATGNNYSSIGSGTIPASGTLVIPVIAASPGGSFADPSNSGAIKLVTSLPGVTITNPAGNYSPITHVGSGTGTLTLGGSPVGNHSLSVSVTATSAGNPATVSYSLDSAPAVALGSVSSVTNLAGIGINITFVAGIGTSWAQGDTYQFSTPGSWITQQGNDQEADTALAQRCRNRWSSLSDVPTMGYYQLLVTSEPTYGSQVTQAIVIPDGVINNKINVVVAGSGGVLPSLAITGLQTFITPRARGCDNPVVQSPTSLNVTFAGTVTCSANLLASVQTAVQAAMTQLASAAGINGTIKISSIIQGARDAGATDATGITINGVASNLTLGSSSSFVVASLQALAFTYVTT